jgi:outer membrane protein TolC
MKLFFGSLAASLLLGTSLLAQMNPSSFANPFYGSVPVKADSSAALRNDKQGLTLDEAIKLGLKQNLGLRESENKERAYQGLRQESLQALLPTVLATGGYSHHEYDLAAQDGFRSGLLAVIGKLMPGLNLATFSTHTQAHIVTADLVVQQQLFSLSAFDTWRQSGAAAHSAYFQKMSARGEVVQRVATTYLAVLADRQHLEDAKALEKADHLLLDQTAERHAAGVAANLDELRARVEDQRQQQVVLAAENALAKNEILLKREIGLSPGEAIELSDSLPYADLAGFTAAEGLTTALDNRQDWLSLGNELQAADYASAAIRHQRLPRLSFNGQYGMTGVTGGVYHGTMAAFSTLSVPVFDEASQRGQQQVANANLNALRLQQSDLRTEIDQQVRDALLDVQATSELVKVAESNVELATRALSDTTDRYKAGIDDNLPVVDAQAVLADAESRRVDTLYQYNVAKLQLARATGILETQYRSFLGR